MILVLKSKIHDTGFARIIHSNVLRGKLFSVLIPEVPEKIHSGTCLEIFLEIPAPSLTVIRKEITPVISQDMFSGFFQKNPTENPPVIKR